MKQEWEKTVDVLISFICNNDSDEIFKFLVQKFDFLKIKTMGICSTFCKLCLNQGIT